MIYLALGVLIISLIAFFYVTLKNVKLKGGSSGGYREIIDKETRDRYVKNITNVMKNFNLKTIASTVTEFMYSYIDQTVAVLKRIGIRKEIDIIEANTPQANSASMNIVVSDGKNNMSAALVGGSIVEKYIDNVTDKVLYEKRIEDGYYILK